VYYSFQEDQVMEVKKCIAEQESEYDKRILTMVLPFVEFKENKEEYQNYYLKNPEKQFCTRYIEPKLKLLRSFPRVAP